MTEKYVHGEPDLNAGPGSRRHLPNQNEHGRKDNSLCTGAASASLAILEKLQRLSMARPIQGDFLRRLLARNSTVRGIVFDRKPAIDSAERADDPSCRDRISMAAGDFLESSPPEFVPLNLENAENRYLLEPTDILTAEKIFDACWALTLLGRTMTQLAEEYATQGRASVFETLKVFLRASGACSPSYEEAAKALGVSVGAAKSLIHRLRKRCASIVREEVARTVSDPGEIDPEIHALCAALIASGGSLDP